MAKRSSAPRISSRNPAKTAVIRQFTPQKKVYFVSWDLTESCKDRSSKFITQKKILPPQNRVCKWHIHSSKHRLQRNRYVLGSPPKEVAHTQLRTGCKAISPAPRISPKGPAKTSVIKPFTTLKKVYSFLRTGSVSNLQASGTYTAKNRLQSNISSSSDLPKGSCKDKCHKTIHYTKKGLLLPQNRFCYKSPSTYTPVRRDCKAISSSSDLLFRHIHGST